MSSDYGGIVLEDVEDFYSGTKKSNTVRNLLIVSSLLLLSGLVGIGLYIFFVSGTEKLFSNLFTLGGAFPDSAIAVNALVILSAICITIALGIAINKQINSKTLKALVNFVLTLALGMGTVALLAFMFGITVPNLFAGFADLAAVFSQGASAQAILTGIILAISLISLVVAFVTYKSGGDHLMSLGGKQFDESVTTPKPSSVAPDLEMFTITFHGNNKRFKAYYNRTKDSFGNSKYTSVDKTLPDVPPEFFSENSDLKHVKLQDAFDSYYTGELVKEYSSPQVGARRLGMQQGVSPRSGSNPGPDPDSSPSSR